MSSQIPTRRTTRATRLQDENAVKGRQPTTRVTAKPGAAPAVAGSSKPAGNAALDINAQNKRKREALGEVTNNNKNKNIPRGISKDGKLVKPHVLITKPAPRTVGQVPARKTRASVAATTKEVDIPEAPTEELADDAMVVDEPVATQTFQRVSRRVSTRVTSTVTTAAATATTTTRRGTLTRRAGSAAVARQTDAVVVDEEHVDGRAAKRRRTSSEAGDEDVVEAEVEIDAVPADIAELEVEEAEEEVIGWEDLDKDDFDDPMMVSEYVVDIFKYLSECEDQTLPDPDYIQRQSELRWSQRGVLMDYLIGLHQRFRLCPETLYLTVNLIDRFLSMRVVSLQKLQLVGLVGMFIAAKFEEVIAPSAQHYLAAAAMEDDIKEEDMLKAERYMLKSLNWSVSLYPQPMNWLRRISKADDYDPQVRTVGKFLLEIHVVERRLLGVKPSLLAAASIWLARLILNHTEWTPNLAHYSGYSEKKIIPVANTMINYCLRPDQHEHLVKKYAARRFNKASVFVNDWVTAHWNIGMKVNLAKELPSIKAIARERSLQGLP